MRRAIILSCILLAIAFIVASGSLGVAADEDLKSDEQLLKNAGISSDGLGLLQFFRSRTLTEAAQARLTEQIRKLGDDSYAVREQASNDLVSAGRLATPFLRKALQDPDLEISRRAERCLDQFESGHDISLTLASARLLVVRRPSAAVEVVLRYLPFAGDESIEEELLTTLTTLGISQGNAVPALFGALQDGNEIRRAAGALVVGKSGNIEQRNAVRALLTDVVPRVRMRAAQGLLASRDRQAIPALIALVGDGPEALAWQAEEMLHRLAGEKAPSPELGSAQGDERRKCFEAWDAWWRDRGDKIDLAKIEQEERPRGFTLVVLYDCPNTGGRGQVFELGVDGKPRWKIDNVNGPVDAQVLPGGRVLIAEYDAKRFTERTLEGAVVWERKAEAPPINCRRLSNGNTFLVTSNDILEITPSGQEVFHITGQHIYSAKKLPGARVAVLDASGSIVEMDEKGKELKRFKASNPPVGLLKFDVLPGGRYLVPQQTTGKLIEYGSDGKSIRECSIPSARVVTRLPNGNALLCGHNSDLRIVEVDRAGKVVFEQKLEGHAHWASRR